MYAVNLELLLFHNKIFISIAYGLQPFNISDKSSNCRVFTICLLLRINEENPRKFFDKFIVI